MRKGLNDELFRRMLRSPLHGLFSRDLLLITFAGRKSGKSYTTPLNYVRKGGTVLMTTDARWWRNLRSRDGSPVPVSLRLEGRELPGLASPVIAEAGEAEVARALEKMLAKFPRYGRYTREGSLDSQGRLTAEESVRARMEGRVLIRVELLGVRQAR